MATLTEEQKQNYLNNTNKCPHCKSENISAESMQTDGKEAWCYVYCYDCDEEWKDIYKLVSVENK